MRCSSRPSRAMQTGAARMLASRPRSLLRSLWRLSATRRSGPERRQTLPSEAPTGAFAAGDVNSDMSAGATVANLGSSFLERLGNQATNGFGSALRGTIRAAAAPPRRPTRRAFRSLGRGLWHFESDQRAGRFRRRSSPDLGRRRRASARASRPASMSDFRSTKAIPRSTFRSRCSPQGSISPSSASTPRSTKGRGHGRSRWFTDSARSIRAGTPGSARPGRLRRPDRRRADRAQLLLDHGPEPHRAKGGVRICPRCDRIVAGGRRPRSGDRRAVRQWIVRGS